MGLWTETKKLVDGEFNPCQNLRWTVELLFGWLTHVVHIISSTKFCNLLDTSLSDAAVTSKFMSIDETYLSTWLINNYIGRCAQLCPSYISRSGLSDDVGSSVKLQKAISEIVRWRLDSGLRDTFSTVSFFCWDINPITSFTAVSYCTVFIGRMS